MLDWHSCQICYPLEMKLLLLLASHNDKLTHIVFFFCRSIGVLRSSDTFQSISARSINLYIYAFPGQPPRQYSTSWCSFFHQ